MRDGQAGAATRGASGAVNKSAWIRAQDPTMPAAEVVAKAKAAGIKLSQGQVYTARSAAKRAARVSSALPAEGAASSPEFSFVQAVGELGLARAQALLDTLKKL